MNYLLIALGVGVSLLVIYLLARKYERFGGATGFLCAIMANSLVRIEDSLEQAAGYWHRACLASLRGLPATEYWVGIDVLSRLVFFCLAVCILGGETVSTMIVLPALLQTTSHVQLSGGIAEIASAALFLCCSALFGAIILECWGKIYGTGLFRNMGKPSRWIVGVISFVLLLFTILVNYAFYVYRAEYLADPHNAQGMAVYILGGLGIEVSAVSPFALLALTVGGAGVVSLLLWLAEVVCKIIGTGASFLPHMLDVIGIRVCGMSVYQKFRKPIDCSLPTVFFHPTGQAGSALLPQDAALADSGMVQVVPIDPPETETLPLRLPTEKETASKPEKNGVVREYQLRFVRKVTPVLPEQLPSDQTSDTSQNDTVNTTKKKATRATRKVKPAAPAPVSVPRGRRAKTISK